MTPTMLAVKLYGGADRISDMVPFKALDHMRLLPTRTPEKRITGKRTSEKGTQRDWEKLFG